MNRIVFLMLLCCALVNSSCIQEFPMDNSPCPCTEGWRCCVGDTGEDVCIPETESCPCEGAGGGWIVGDMDVDPGNIPSNGHDMAEIGIWVFAVCGEQWPLDNIEVTVHSSRNKADADMDFFEQPTNPTDSDGRAVAYVRSFTPGDAMLFATADNETLCGVWEETDCVESLQMIITFDP